MTSEKCFEKQPWVEKYRPKCFENIILDSENRKILNTIINTKILQNILFYGPPGTGKTTTILNFIKKYQNKYDENADELVIHLNASDERGIDVIRNQIFTFVNSKSLFNKGRKFIILDEVDYMTKSAQLALKAIVNQFDKNICFCLICNYISRIDRSLQDIFIHFRFNSLPQENIQTFIENITLKENININTKRIKTIIERFDSDIRSMINYIQINQHDMNEISILNSNIYEQILDTLRKKSVSHTMKYIYSLSNQNNISLREIFKNLCYEIIKKVSTKHHEYIKYALHDKVNSDEELFLYLLSSIKNEI